ncbi:tyrosine-type recombinase/integrase, partial [Gordonia sp. (in: high G+C Gram-positive bacteria)]
LGGLQLREMTAARVQALFTRTLSATGARRAAPPLRMILDVAVAADALTTNPARQIRLPRKQQTDTEYLTAEQILDLRAKLDLWADGKLPGQKTDYHRTRRASRTSLPDIVDLAVATGCRTSEILALRFQDVDFAADPVTVTVTGTLVRVAGQGTIRQPFTKTDAGHRTLTLPGFAETVLRDRLRDRRLGVTDGVVFPGDDGGLLTANAVQREWRLCRDLAGFPGLELRALRRSVATLIAEAAGVDAAAAQLGHHGTAVTEKHYIARKAAVVPNLTELLQALA